MALAALAGCSGQGTFLTGGPTVGQLKAGVSHLEFENQQLKRSVAKLENENRAIEDRLVQERIVNGDLTARLDDARNLLRERGVNADLRVGSRRDDERAGESASNISSPKTRTRPAGQSSSKSRRKTPFAEIPGQLDASPSTEPQDGAADAERAGAMRRRSRRAGADFDDDLDRHADNASTLQWLPVADGSTDSSSRLR